MTNWKSIYRTRDRVKAEIVKDVLEANDITVVLLNKQDSSYVIIGDFEIHVPREEVVRAIKIINDDIDTE